MALAATVVVSGCASGGSPVSPSGTPTPPTGSATATGSPSATADGAVLVGRWQADAGSILAANTANVGGPGAISCSGPIVMTFTAAGTYSRAGRIRCAVRGQAVTGAVATVGDYATSGDVLTVSRTRREGSGPVPDAWGDGTATYSITGDTLAITFTQGPVGTVTQHYQRS